MISRRDFLQKLGCTLFLGFLLLKSCGRLNTRKIISTSPTPTSVQPVEKSVTQELPIIKSSPSAIPHKQTPQYKQTPHSTLPDPTKVKQPVSVPEPTYFHRDFISSISAEMVEFIANHPIQHGDQARKIIMMTYDDGNRNEYIHRILDVYQEFGAQCTFFFLGIHIQRCAKAIERAANEGHLIGFHGYDHEKPMVQLRNEEVRRQIEGFLEELSVILPGYPVRFWRSPYGSYNSRILKIAAEYGLQHVGWSVESGGMSEETVEILRKGLKRYATVHGLSTPNGAIVLSHASRYYDVHLAADVLELIQSYGLQPVTVAEGMKSEDRYKPALDWNGTIN